jgi:hypothetical protein
MSVEKLNEVKGILDRSIQEIHEQLKTICNSNDATTLLAIIGIRKAVSRLMDLSVSLKLGEKYEH